jgi:ketosteroid isomerase-like protein
MSRRLARRRRASAEVTAARYTRLRGDLDEWVAAFAHVWEAPRQRLDALLDLLSPEVVLKAPTTPPVSRGRAAGRAAFERAFRAMPDLRAVVHGWSATGGTLFIEMTFHATIGGRPVAWDDVDRFRFEGGQAVERVAYFDPAPVRRAFLSNPRGVGQLLKLRLGL